MMAERIWLRPKMNPMNFGGRPFRTAGGGKMGGQPDDDHRGIAVRRFHRRGRDSRFAVGHFIDGRQSIF